MPYKDFLVRITYKSFYSQQAEGDMIKVDQYWLRIGDVCEQYRQELRVLKLVVDHLVYMID